LLLKPDGVGVQIPAVTEGAIALEVHPLFGVTGVIGNLVNFTLTSTSRVGIIVQRIVGTGVFVALPAAVQTPGNELHPALSPDAKRLVFLANQNGAVRVIMVDLATGQSADLFNAFEAASDPPTTPTFSSDGTSVITGRRLEHRDASTPPEALQATYTQTDVRNFPAGPFPKTIVSAGGLDSTSAGRTLQPTAFGTGRVAIGIQYTATGGPPGRITVQAADGTTTLSDPTAGLGNPTVSGSAGVVVFERGTADATRLVFRPLAGIASASTTELPPLVNASGMREVLPEFSRDGRYLAFTRQSAIGGAGRMFVLVSPQVTPHAELAPEGVHAEVAERPALHAMAAIPGRSLRSDSRTAA
jgi:hypothetical protein